MRIVGCHIVLFLLVAACIEPFPLQSINAEETIVVDGMITDQPGPYTVRISSSTSPLDAGSTPEMISGASVWILCDDGRSIPLNETSTGLYTSNPEDLRGEIGKTYSLKIVTEEGTEFQSSPETLLPAGEIDSLYAVYLENSINPAEPSLPQDAITFFVDARTDAQNTNGYLRWRATTIYEILTHPELRTAVSEDGPIPDPLPCSGYINENNQLAPVGQCTCCSCWVYEYPRNAAISPNQFANANTYRKVGVATVPVDKWRFFRKYYFELEQLSVSENVFRFWKGVSAQQQGSGSLFQPNAVRIRGNIKCVTDPELEVFGIFAASAVIRQSMFVTRSQLPKPIGAPDTVVFDCRYAMEHADKVENIKPPFW